MSEYRNDIHSAHAKIDSLEREKQVLEEKLAKKNTAPKKEKKMSNNCYKCYAGNFFWAATAFVVAASLTWLIALSIIHNGERGSCYVESGGEANMIFKLERAVPWNPDDTIGSYRSMDEALADAKKLNCEVK